MLNQAYICEANLNDMIQKIKFKKSGTKELEATWLAPYAESEAFIIDGAYLILDGDVYPFYDNDYEGIYEVIEIWD